MHWSLRYTSQYSVTNYIALITTLQKSVHYPNQYNTVQCTSLYGSHKDRLEDWAALSDLITLQQSKIRLCDIQQSKEV